MTLEQARRLARLVFRSCGGRQRPQVKHRPNAGDRDGKELAEFYINGHAKPKKKTWKIDEAYLNQLLIPRFGAHLASSITQGRHREHSRGFRQKAPLRRQSIHLDCSKNV